MRARRNGVVGKRDARSVGIVNRNRRAFLGGEGGQIAGAFVGGGHAAVLAERRGRALPGSIEEDHVFGVVLDQVRNIGRAHKGEPKLILGVAGLRLLLGLDGERSGIQRRVPTCPKERAMGLVGLEIAEIAESAATSAAAAPASSETSASEASTASAKSAASTRATPSRPSAAGPTSLSAGPCRTTLASADGKGLIQLCVLAKLLHIDTGKGIGCACLSGNGNRVGGEVGVVGEGGQGCSGGAGVDACVGRARELGEQGKILGSSAGIAPHRARRGWAWSGRRALLGRLRRDPRSEC